MGLQRLSPPHRTKFATRPVTAALLARVSGDGEAIPSEPPFCAHDRMLAETNECSNDAAVRLRTRHVYGKAIEV